MSMDRRYWLVGLVLVGGIFISHEFYHFTKAEDVAQAQIRFEERAADRLTSVEQSIVAKQEVLRSLVGFFEGSQNVDREEFKLFVRSALKRFPSVQALEWIPRVTASERSTIEATVRKEGFEDFRLTERTSDGTVITAGPRHEYFPVFYAEPYNANRKDLGFDLGSNPNQRAAMGKARDTDSLTTSAMIEFSEGGAIALVYAPIYRTGQPNETVLQRRQNLRGFARAVLNIEQMVEVPFKTRRTLKSPAGIDVYLYDDAAAKGQQLLYSHRSRKRANSEGFVLSRANVESGPRLSVSFPVGDRTWSIIAKPMRSDFGVVVSLMAWSGALLPTLLAMVLAAYIYTLFGQSHRLEKEVAERRQAEEKMRTAKKEAESANQAKSRFLASMSHDLRTPLNAILGFADFISNQYLGPLGVTKYKEYAEDIHSSGELLLALVNDILDLSAIESGKLSLAKESLSTKDFVMECEKFIKQKAESLGIDLTTKVPSDILPLYADKRAAKQILINLLSNAVKFTPEGGKITIGVTATNGHHIIEISDTGTGIPADKIATIADPFVRGESNPHKSQEGTGLGLAIVKSLVGLHGGDFDIQSTVGKGTTVTVKLPGRANQLEFEIPKTPAPGPAPI